MLCCLLSQMDDCGLIRIRSRCGLSQAAPLRIRPGLARILRLRCATLIDIAAIGAAPFQRHQKNKDTEVFITSLSEINRIIEEKRAEERRNSDQPDP